MAKSTKKTDTSSPSDLELQILSVLWERGPSTAREVLEALPDGKQRAYTTVLTVMQIMRKKKLLGISDRRGLAHVYRPLASKRKVLGPMMRGLVKRVFGGSPSAVVQQLLHVSTLSKDELDEIVRLVNDAAAEKNKGEDT